ncbi:MAG: HAMP domain-containing histidine kinase [Myxococcales bacterium]|nr:HAMP domain-containing histidine kinase [Myxococcales bacterium]
MRRISLVYLLIPAMLAAAASLAYYGYSYSQQLAMRERQAILATMAELAKEKLIGIQTAIAETDQSVFDVVDFADLPQLGQTIFVTQHRSATVLGPDHRIISGGTFRKAHQRDDEAFAKLLTERVVPDMQLDSIALNSSRYLHAEYGGRHYLFTATRLFSKGRMYFVLLEADISYLIAEVFPAFFDVRSPNLYQVVDAQGTFIYGYAFSGVPAADVVELGFPETLTLWRLRVAQRDAGALASSETRQKTLDLVLIAVAMAVIAAGLLIMVAAVWRERRVSQLKSDFISNVSHELKTPLSIISMFGELLAMGRSKSPEQAVEYAEIIRRESLRLSSLIDNVLDFAKIEGGGLPYSFDEDQDITEVVMRGIEICRPRLEQANMELTLDLAGDIPPTRLDCNAMVLCVSNLVDNAIKYAASGKRIEIELKVEGHRIALVVRDFGPGIPRDEQGSVFDRFYRAKDIRLKTVRGSGIGLSLVKNIVTAHRATIEVDSEVEGGSVFRISLPITGSMPANSP